MSSDFLSESLAKSFYWWLVLELFYQIFHFGHVIYFHQLVLIKNSFRFPEFESDLHILLMMNFQSIIFKSYH